MKTLILKICSSQYGWQKVCHCCDSIFCLMSEILSNRSVKYFGGVGSRDPALDLNPIRLPMTFIYVEYMMMQWLISRETEAYLGLFMKIIHLYIFLRKYITAKSR